jgi:alpha-beta hydrolase superfamily lysophospholipase
MRQVVVRADVSDAVGLGEPLQTAATVCLPDSVSSDPVVCFAFPGGGYSRRYFTFDMPGDKIGGQAGWHTSRGWIFVACDHLHCGESSQPTDPGKITYEHLVAANEATVQHVLGLLAHGELADDVPPIAAPATIGIGQSLGGATLILQQGQRATFDGIGVLGWSGRHTVNWVQPGSPKTAVRYFPRGTDVGALTPEVFTTAMPEMAMDEKGMPASTPSFHFDDEPADVVAADMIDYPSRRGNMPVWGSATIPPCSMTMMSPGSVAPEAASITVPVLIAVGERDACPDVMSEPKAYERATDVTVFVCPRMAHMHNFASTRQSFWARIHAWGEGVVALSRTERPARLGATAP